MGAEKQKELAEMERASPESWRWQIHFALPPDFSFS
jgi:hypothetical protein